MSSQGPNTTAVAGYPFSKLTIGDSSGWIAFKKQALIANEKVNAPNGFPSDPWQITSGDRRLDVLMGRYKLGITSGCSACATNQKIEGNGNPYTNNTTG
jgi:hypothetical protein